MSLFPTTCINAESSERNMGNLTTAIDIAIFLSGFILFIIAAEREMGVNDCVKTTIVTVERRVIYFEPTVEHHFRFCWSIPPKCSYEVYKMSIKERRENRSTPTWRPSCCQGYQLVEEAQDVMSFPICQPECGGLCGSYGICVEPHQCLCLSGRKGNSCSISDDLRTSSKTLSTGETTVETDPSTHFSLITDPTTTLPPPTTGSPTPNMLGLQEKPVERGYAVEEEGRHRVDVFAVYGATGAVFLLASLSLCLWLLKGCVTHGTVLRHTQGEELSPGEKYSSDALQETGGSMSSQLSLDPCTFEDDYD